MQQTILLKAPGRRYDSPTVILSAINISAQSTTTIGQHIAATARRAWQRIAHAATPSAIATAATTAAGIVTVAAAITGYALAADIAAIAAVLGIFFVIPALEAKEGGRK